MRVVVVPPVPALLPGHVSLKDPVAELRAACSAAVAWLVEDAAGARVVADTHRAGRVGSALLGNGSGSSAPVDAVAAGPGTRLGPVADGPLLVLANGSARRSEKAPGHLDERSFDFDTTIEAALAGGDAAALADIPVDLAEQLLADGVHALRGLADLTVTRAVMDYADDPFGVRYWVVRWECAS